MQFFPKKFIPSHLLLACLVCNTQIEILIMGSSLILGSLFLQSYILNGLILGLMRGIPFSLFSKCAFPSLQM